MKPGYKTSEFWMTAVTMIMGLIMASGAVLEGSMAAQIVGGVIAVLSKLGYDASRTTVKTAAFAAGEGPEVL
jgi:hypothetical protein